MMPNQKAGQLKLQSSGCQNLNAQASLGRALGERLVLCKLVSRKPWGVRCGTLALLP